MVSFEPVATDKRERQRANRELKKQQEAKEERQEQVRQYGLTAAIVAVAIITSLGLLYLATQAGDDANETEAAESTETTDVTETTAPEVEVPQSAVELPEPGAAIDGETDCPPEDGSAERVTSFSQAPPTCIDETASYSAEIATTLGTINVELDAAAAPITVNNFVVLARYHYYDGSPFHRIIPGFVIQGGDAVGPVPGQGNPGYLIEEEPPTPADGELAYEIGSLAMAKAQAPQSTGSQFFIVTGDDGTNLPPEYSLFGTVTAGMDVVTAIESIPTTPDDSPTEPIYIESVTITEG